MNKYVVFILVCVLLSGCGIEKTEINKGYFYGEDYVLLTATAKYNNEDKWGLSPYGVEDVYIGVNKLRTYENGALFKLAIDSVGDLQEGRLNIYFYVTNDKIYRLWSYVYADEGMITFYDDDDLLMSTLDSEEKLIKNSDVVCQPEEIRSDPEQGGEGKNFNIVKKGNQIHYNRYDVSPNGERYFYEWFHWEKEKGLVEYGSGYKVEKDILYLDNISIVR